MPNPSDYGAVPVGSPDPSKYGAVPVDQPAGWSSAATERLAGSLGKKREAKEADMIRQMDPGIDYSGFNDPSGRALFSLMKTPEEKVSFLQDRYGKENVTVDSFGRPVIKHGDKLVSYLPKGYTTSKTLGADFADYAGEVLPMAGMIGGAVLGAPSIGGSMLLSGSGAIIGEAGNKAIKGALGYNKQSGPEQVVDLAKQGAIGVAGEGLSQTAMLAGRTLMAPYAERSLLGPNIGAKPAFRDSMAALDAARAEGLTPAVGQASPNANFVQRAQNARNRLFGDPLPLKNRPIIDAKNESLVSDVSGREQSPITQKSIVSQGESASKDLSAAATRSVADAEQVALSSQKEAYKVLNDATESITRKVGAPQGNVSASISEDIRKSRKVFSEKASEMYAPVDAMVGKPVVPNQGLKDEMNKILAEGPQSNTGNAVFASDAIKKFAADINSLPEFSTFQQMQVVRSMLKDKSAVDALNAGLSERQATRLAAAADRSFNDAVSEITKRTTTKSGVILDKSGNPAIPAKTTVTREPVEGVDDAIKALRRADQFYAAGIKRYNDLSVEALVKDATQSGFVQPERIAQYVAAPGQVDKLLRIKKVISPESFQEVGREKWSQLVNASTDSLTADISGKKLSDRLMQMGGTLDALYGSKTASEMRVLSKQLAALDGKIPADSLVQGPITDVIKKAVADDVKFKMVASNNYLGLIKSEGSESLRAADFLTDPSNRLKFRNAIQTLGANDPSVVGAKEYLARKIFASMEVAAHATQEKYTKTVLSGDALKETLAKYGRPYLEEVFGKKWSDTVHKWADAVATGTRRNPADSGGLAAASLGMHPLKNIMDLAHFGAIGWATNTQPFITYISKGIKGTQGEVAQVFREMAALTTRAGIEHGLERSGDKAKDTASGLQFHMQKEGK